MAMTAKHYSILADWLNYCQNTTIDEHAISILVAKLQANDDKFNKDKFLRECGL